jgi:hypothetical protein
MIQALKSRHGDSQLIDQYRAQLHDRKRKDGESISDLCDDLSQLLVLGFPNADEETRNYIGKEVFFRAIEANANLQMWVRDREPRNLEDCRTLATKAEANASISNYKAFEIKENKFSKRGCTVRAPGMCAPRHVRPSHVRPGICAPGMRPRYVRPSHVRSRHVRPRHLNNEKNEVVDIKAEGITTHVT